MTILKLLFYTYRSGVHLHRTNTQKNTYLNYVKFFSTKCRTVLVSLSNDIYTNLAVEDWIYKNKKFENEEILFLWRNEPTVVIGRHQNPWLECNLNYLRNNNINLARRNSGGGAVYHDLGNLNYTFFTTRKKYNRRNNLQLICNSLIKRWDLGVEISKREDIILNGEFKISGTAAKLGNPNAYHHCTLLFNADKDLLKHSLDKENGNIESTATSSVRGTVKNLKEECQDIDFWSLVEAITQEYLGNSTTSWNNIEPNEGLYPGLETIRNGLMDWNWVYGHTPKFVIRKQFITVQGVLNTSQVQIQDESSVQRDFHRDLSTSLHPKQTPVTLTLQVYRAKITEFSITPENFLPNQLLNIFQKAIVNKLFKVEEIASEMNAFKNKTNDERIVFIFKCIKDMIRRA